MLEPIPHSLVILSTSEWRHLYKEGRPTVAIQIYTSHMARTYTTTMWTLYIPLSWRNFQCLAVGLYGMLIWWVRSWISYLALLKHILNALILSRVLFYPIETRMTLYSFLPENWLECTIVRSSSTLKALATQWSHSQDTSLRKKESPILNLFLRVS